MAKKSRLLQLDGLIAFSFFITNLVRTEWIEGPGRFVLIILILLSIGFIVTLFFTQKGFSTLRPLGLVAVLVGFVPSALWYLVRLLSRLNLDEIALAADKIYEFTNMASLAVLVVLLPYLFLRKQS